MITIKGVTTSMLNVIRMMLGTDAITCVDDYDTPSLWAITFSNDVVLVACSKGFIVLSRNCNVVTLTSDDYVEISIY